MTASVDIKLPEAATGDDAVDARADLLRAFLATRDVPCPNCEYTSPSFGVGGAIGAILPGPHFRFREGQAAGERR